MNDWSSWPDFVQAQFDALSQTKENIARWKRERKQAVKFDTKEAARLERLIFLAENDMRAQAAALKELTKGRQSL